MSYSLSFPSTYKGHAAAGEDICQKHGLTNIDNFTLEGDRPCTIKINDDPPAKLGEEDKKRWRIQSGGKVTTLSGIFGTVNHIVFLSECDYVLTCSQLNVKL